MSTSPRAASRPGAAIMALLACAILPLLPTSAWSGTLCGTIRDAQTQAPVPRAGVFLRTPVGGYTGYHAATGNDGAFCLAGIPAGTYDLEVRVDAYRVAYQRNVVINDSVSGVDLLVPPPLLHLAPPSPNPARGAVRLGFELKEPGPVRLLVFDAQGRLVRGWESDLPAGEHAVAWDLRTADGAHVAAGFYLVRLYAATGRREQRLVVIGPRQ